MRATFLDFCPEHKREDALRLASCIAIARVYAKNENSDNEIYWHTRETCFSQSTREGVSWFHVMSALNFAGTFKIEELRKMAGNTWIKTAHPEIIVREVLES